MSGAVSSGKLGGEGNSTEEDINDGCAGIAGKGYRGSKPLMPDLGINKNGGGGVTGVVWGGHHRPRLVQLRSLGL